MKKFCTRALTVTYRRRSMVATHGCLLRMASTTRLFSPWQSIRITRTLSMREPPEPARSKVLTAARRGIQSTKTRKFGLCTWIPQIATSSMPVPMAMVSTKVQTRELLLSAPARRSSALSCPWRKVETACMQVPRLREFPSAKTTAQLGQIQKYPTDWVSFLAWDWTDQSSREPTSTECSSIQRRQETPTQTIAAPRSGEEWPGDN